MLNLDSPAIEIFVPGMPIAKQSFRMTWQNGKAVGYQKQPVRSWQALVSASAIQVAGMNPVLGRLSIVLEFFIPYNKADIDNLSKAVLDGLQGIIFENDRQVFHLSAKKTITKEKLGVLIKVEKLKC